MKLSPTITIIWIFLTQSAICQLNTTTDCNNPVPNSCNFYIDCLEDKFHCGPNGYPVNYGVKYCEKFVNFKSDFSKEGQEWIIKTMLCLQYALRPIYNNSESTCEEIDRTAFGSHANCYIKTGVCTLPITDWKHIFKVVDLKVLFGNLEVFKQAAITAKLCVDFYIELLKEHWRKNRKQN